MREAGASGGVGRVSGQGSRVLLGTVSLEGKAVPATFVGQWRADILIQAGEVLVWTTGSLHEGGDI